jgi:hypothetical protein
MPEPQHGLNSIKEFLLRKGPAGIPYWGFGLMGAAVVGGVIYLNSSGALSGLTSALGGGAAGSGGGGTGSGAGSIPIPDTSAPSTPSVPGGGGLPPVSGLAPNGPTSQASSGIAPADPLLIGQQSGATGGVISTPIAAPVSDPRTLQTPVYPVAPGQLGTVQMFSPAAPYLSSLLPGILTPAVPNIAPTPLAATTPATLHAPGFYGSGLAAIAAATPQAPAPYIPPTPVAVTHPAVVHAPGFYGAGLAAIAAPVPTTQLNAVQSAAKSRRTSGNQNL